MEKVKVKTENCVGCGMCIGQNPEYFTFDDDGHSKVIKEEVKPEDKENVLQSIEMCPTEAIVIEEEK